MADDEEKVAGHEVLGPAIPWTEADLDDLSRVTPEAVEKAVQWWKDAAAPGYKPLIDAGPDGGSDAQEG